jgi:tetratricopeptide (TPR) repeat protein
MKGRNFFILFAAVFVLALSLPQDLRAENTSKTIALLKQGIEKGCNLDQKGAVADITRACEIDRDNPLPYAFLAVTHLFFLEISFDEKEKKVLEESLLRFVQDANTRAGKRIDKNARDGGAYFAMALAKLSKNRLEMTKKNYLNAFRGAQNIWDYLEKTREYDPENYDVYFPMGVLHYHLDHLPGSTRFITSLVLVKGDREKGLQELQLAVEKGDLLKELARLELISVYSGYEKQPWRVLPMAREMGDKYPHNYNFAFAIGGMLANLGHGAEAFAVARKVENGISSGAPPYRPELWPRYYHLMGRIHLENGEYDKAMEYFQRVLTDDSPYNFKVRAWTWCRIGMVHDAKKERKLAEECYKKALGMEGIEGLAKVSAKEYLKTPYSPKSHAGNREIQIREEVSTPKKTN